MYETKPYASKKYDPVAVIITAISQGEPPTTEDLFQQHHFQVLARQCWQLDPGNRADVEQCLYLLVLPVKG